MYDLKNNGVGYAISNEAINQYAGTLEKLKQDIIDGDDRRSGRSRPAEPDVRQDHGRRRASGASCASSG